MAQEHNPFDCPVTDVGAVPCSHFVAARALAAMATAIVSRSGWNLCGGAREPCVSGSDYRFWNDGLESAKLFAAGVGLAVHPRFVANFVRACSSNRGLV